MAQYTVELRTIIDSGYNIFDFPYDFYKEENRKQFEQDFIDHFYFYEIGCETVGRFQHYLRLKFRETFPYYNELFKMAELEYNKLFNYDVTETYTKNNISNASVTGVTDSEGKSSDLGTSGNTLNRTTGAIATGEKSQNLDSTTDHSEDQNFYKDEGLTETVETEGESNLDIDNKKVESETPSGLLAMKDIKSNVYASKALIDDNTNKQTETNSTTTERAAESTESTDKTSLDTVKAINKETSTDTNDETLQETNSGHNSNNITFDNKVNNSQSQNGTNNETFSRTMQGNIGVQTTSDLLEKEIILQQKLKTISLQFFNECDDLFMQIFSF